MTTKIKIRNSSKGAFVPLTASQMANLNAKIGDAVDYEFRGRALILKRCFEG